jgi:hypothetical protein
MAISPARLPSITAYHFPTLEIETSRLKVHLRSDRPAKDIRFPSARGARTGTPKFLERDICFFAIRPGNGELGSYLLNRCRLEHSCGDYKGATNFELFVAGM